MAGELSARIGSNFSDYVGNPQLGGNTAQVFNIDTKPLENLAHYTFYYNRSLWEQKQRDTDAKIKELADLSKISLNNLKGKDKEQATKEFAQLQKDAADYARKSPKTAQEKMQDTLDWQVKYGAFNNNYNSGKTRAISYYKRYNDIMAGTEDAKTKDAQIAILDKEFNDTDIATPISGVQAFKTQKFDVPDPTAQKFQSVIIADNENVAIEGAVYNPKLNAGVADVAIIGLKKVYPQKGTPEYEKLSQSEKNQAEVQATVESGAKGWVDATEPLNQVLKGYIDADGNFDAAKFEDENASNITLMNAYNALKRYDSYNREKYTQAKSGVFNDKGLSVKLPPNLNPEDFKAGFVDFSKGVNANQLVQSGMFAKYQGDLFTKKVTETDNAIQRSQQALAERMNNADNAAAYTRARLPYDEAKVGQKDAAGNQADFGNLIYGVKTQGLINISTPKGDKIKNVKIVNGVLIGKDGKGVDYTGDLKLPSTYFDNSIPVEYNKYVGGTKTDPTTGEVLATSTPTKLLSQNGKYTVRFENGEIKGIYAEGETSGDGDKEKGTLITVEQFDHITRQAALKGATKARPGNPDYGKFQTPVSGSGGMTDEEFNLFLKRNNLQ